MYDVKQYKKDLSEFERQEMIDRVKADIKNGRLIKFSRVDNLGNITESHEFYFTDGEYRVRANYEFDNSDDNSPRFEHIDEYLNYVIEGILNGNSWSYEVLPNTRINEGWNFGI